MSCAYGAGVVRVVRVVGRVVRVWCAVRLVRGGACGVRGGVWCVVVRAVRVVRAICAVRVVRELR